jgi:hypothetical protein
VSLFNKRMFARQLMYILSSGKGPFPASRRKSDTYLMTKPFETAACSLGMHEKCALYRPTSVYKGPCACRCHILTNTQR